MAEQRRVLGKQIRAAREGKRWKQKQLAAAVSVEPDTVSRWENGRHAPDLDTLTVIARETGKPLSFFVDDIAEATSTRLPADAEVLARLLALEAGQERTEGLLLELLQRLPAAPVAQQEAQRQ